MDLSIVLGGRDDNYGENFIERLQQAVSTNLDLLDKSGLDYEMIVVDFNPIDDQYLHDNSILKESLSHKRVKNIIVDNSVICEEELSPKMYYEYFAKNAGCRVSSGEFIFVTNSDILLTEDLIDKIKVELNNDDRNNYYYRVRYRGDISLNDTPSPTPRIIPNGDVLTGPLNGWGDPEQVLDLYENLKYHGLLQQDPIIGLWSGDASMFSKEVMFKVATGYNEGEVTHRGNLHQSDMDSEILWNLRAKGKELRLIEAPYFHIYHGDRPPRDTTHSRLKYTNKDDWGFVDYNNIDINDNTVLIYGKEATLEYDE
tara:strand:- start:5320 stop:6258 length:939 start_codon:yes stop_codon:yes gene_type:complete